MPLRYVRPNLPEPRGCGPRHKSPLRESKPNYLARPPHVTLDIQFAVKPDTIRPEGSAEGSVSVSYPGRYDGVVVNAQVLDSNHHVTYTSCNGKKVAGKIARLFIPRDQMPGGRADFTAEMKFEADRRYEVKFRASIIEQHKEIESSIVFVTYVA